MNVPTTNETAPYDFQVGDYVIYDLNKYNNRKTLAKVLVCDPASNTMIVASSIGLGELKHITSWRLAKRKALFATLDPELLKDVPSSSNVQEMSKRDFTKVTDLITIYRYNRLKKGEGDLRKTAFSYYKVKQQYDTRYCVHSLDRGVGTQDILESQLETLSNGIYFTLTDDDDKAYDVFLKATKSRIDTLETELEKQRALFYKYTNSIGTPIEIINDSLQD